MIDEDRPNNSHYKHVQATTFGSEEVVKETVNEPSLEDPFEACLAQFGDDLDLDKLLEQVDAYWILLLRCERRRGKPLRYHSLTHLH